MYERMLFVCEVNSIGLMLKISYKTIICC